MPSGHTPAHWINIGVHVAAGTLAMLFGLIAIVVYKRGRNHRRAGLAFLYAYVVVVLTATVGILFFDFRSFLAVVTIVSIYNAFSGYRALQLRGGRPHPQDVLAALFGLSTPWIFIALMARLHQPWSPILTWSVLGGLIATSFYDLLRTKLPATYLHRTWIQEHLVKMIGAYIAITSAAAGTIFPTHMPLAAILPSATGVVVAWSFVLIGPRAWAHRKPRASIPTEPRPSTEPALNTLP